MDIETNFSTIVNNVEESRFEEILGFFKARCENLNLFKQNYRYIPGMDRYEIDYDKIVTKFV